MQFRKPTSQEINNLTYFGILASIFIFLGILITSLNPQVQNIRQASVAGVSTLKRDIEIDFLYQHENHITSIRGNAIKITPKFSEVGTVKKELLRISNKSQIWQDFVIFPVVKGNVQNFIEIKLEENNEEKYLLRKGSASEEIIISVAPNSESDIFIEIQTFKKLLFPYEISLTVE